MIKIENVTKQYVTRAGELRALDNVSLQVDAGEWLAVMGPSGSGKSTLVNLVGCLDRPTAGTIFIDGENIADMDAAGLNRVRAEKIGFIFQQFHLIPYLTALENIMLAQYFHSMTDEQEALDALARVGLRERARHLPGQLSGGEQQRVCIARALINDPRIILADEPTGNLDAQNEEIVLRLLREFHSQGRTIVMVTHDPVVARLADRRIDLHHGRIASQEIFGMEEQEQFDEILEEIWVVEEHGESAEIGRMEMHGPAALPMAIALEKMSALGLVEAQPHPPVAHAHRAVVNPCHEDMHRKEGAHDMPMDGHTVVALTSRGRKRAEDVIRRHRLAERLFTETFHEESEEVIEEQACKFEHILSPEATERICSFLGHPKTCPHGAAIPPGPCCLASEARREVTAAIAKQ